MLFLRGGGVCVICMRKAVDPIDHHASCGWLRDGRCATCRSPYNYTLQTTYLKLRLASRKSDVDRGTRNLEARGEREDRCPPHPVL